MKSRVKHIICITFLFVISFNASGQTRKQLEAQRKKINSQIEKVNKLLFDTQKKEKNALEDLKDLNQKIDVRTQLINAINLESESLSSDITKNEKELEKLSKKLEKLKKDYADMIFKSYKSKSQQSRTMFLLSSQNFYQAYKRLQYMKQYASFRKKQGEEVVVQTEIVQKLKDSLIYKKQVKDTLILVEKQHKEQIETDKKSQETLVSSIKKQEKKYIRELKKKQKEERKIAAKIDKLIKDAIAKSNINKGGKKATGFVLTPEAKALANKFEQNRGKLPWPVNYALVTRRFGTQPHPTLSGITIQSTGLHIATRKGENAKSIFNGKVFAVQLQTGGKKTVLIQHGNYITAYKNLEKLRVKKGDAITTGQALGQVFTDKINGKTTLIFVLFKDSKRLNPAQWILKTSS